MGITEDDAPHGHPEFELGSSGLCGKCFYPQSHLNCTAFTSLQTSKGKTIQYLYELVAFWQISAVFFFFYTYLDPV